MDDLTAEERELLSLKYLEKLNSFTKERPASCQDCPFHSYEFNEGAKCCGGDLPDEIKSPQDALEYNYDCIFSPSV